MLRNMSSTCRLGWFYIVTTSMIGLLDTLSIPAGLSVGRRQCTLCDHEHLAILQKLREPPNKLINSCDETFGSCRHKTKFHRYVSTDSSTDDSIEEENVGPMKVTTEV